MTLEKGKNGINAKTDHELLKARNEELEMINNKMKKIVRHKDEFLANMSHDLRTPLNGIIGFAEIMRDGKAGPLSDEHKEYLDDILSSAHLLLLLINDVLDLAKISSGKMEFLPEKIDISQIVNEVRNIFIKTIQEKHITLKIQINSTLAIIIDPNKLKQIVYNLASNAFKFTPAGGAVTIIVRHQDNDTFTLEVHDTGIGIHQKDFNKLFIAFQKINADPHQLYPGTGLGLALVKRIVEAQGGHIDVLSTLQKGSVFSVTLPCIASQDKYGHLTPSELDVTFNVPTILVIEDPSKERTELLNSLLQLGYQVRSADNIDEAIEKHKFSDIDAVIIDFFIADISKWKLLRAFRLKQPFKKAPTLLITGVVNSVDTFGFKIHDFLIKPVDAKELLTILKWSGANPYSNKVVFIVDDDMQAINHDNKVLKEFGYQTFYESDLEKALLILENDHPDVLILNPFLESKNINGFEFLHRLRLTKQGRDTPIVITTLKILTPEERERIKGIIQHVVLKKENRAKNLINEVIEQIPLIMTSESQLIYNLMRSLVTKLRKENRMSNEPILIVDDNPSNLKLVKVLLRSGHYDLNVRA